MSSESHLEELDRVTFQNANVGIAHVAPDGRWLRFNDWICAFTGYSRAELESLTFADVSHPDDLAGDWAEVRRLLAGDGDRYTIEKRYLRKDGCVVWGSLGVSLVRAPDGTPLYFVSVIQDIDARRRAEAELRSVADTTPDILSRMDRHLRHTFVNAAVERATGQPMSAFLGKTNAELGMPPELCEQWREALESVFTTGRERRMEFEFDGPSGHRFYVSRLVPETGPSGEIEHVLNVAHDITDARVAEQRKDEYLAASSRREAWLEAVLDGSPLGIAVLDRDLRFVRVNPALARINGTTAAAHIGRTIREVIPNAADALEEHYRGVHRTRRPLHDLTISALFAGERQYFAINIYPIAAEDMVVGIVQVTTERERAERRRDLLARASRIFATTRDVQEIAEQVTALFVPAHADFANLYLRRDDGTSELIATSAADPAMVPRIRDVVARRMPASGNRWFHERASRASEYELWPPGDGDPEPLSAKDPAWREAVHEIGVTAVLTVPLVSYGGLIGTLSLARTSEEPIDRGTIDAAIDVAMRSANAIDGARLLQMAQAERRRADEANRAKDEFLAVVSHELRTPLNAMLGWARMLVSGSVPQERVERAIQVIERNAASQAQLIEDLLDYARIITGKLRLEVEPFDVARMMETAIEVVTPSANAKGVRILAALDATIGKVVGDPTRLQQAVWNLLANAVKFTPRGGEVRVSLEQDDDTCVVTVTDTGPGIPPDFLSHVFERFRQAEMGARREFGGLGLGLSIVRHVAELHGGSVEASSRSGEGATFRLRFPMSVATRSNGPPALHPSAAPPRFGSGFESRGTSASVRVLLVDDEEDAREVVAAMLESVGATVTTAASAEEGIAHLRDASFDVIISDIGMPREDGFDFIERVRTLPPEHGPKTKAIALTAYARSEDRTRALLAGFDAHVSKPVEPRDLVAVVQTARAVR